MLEVFPTFMLVVFPEVDCPFGACGSSIGVSVLTDSWYLVLFFFPHPLASSWSRAKGSCTYLSLAFAFFVGIGAPGSFGFRLRLRLPSSCLFRTQYRLNQIDMGCISLSSLPFYSLRCVRQEVYLLRFRDPSSHSQYCARHFLAVSAERGHLRRFRGIP